METKLGKHLEVNEAQRLTFPHGLFGFEEDKEFVLLDSERPPFCWLQSLREPRAAFIVVEPRLFCPLYQSGLSSSDLWSLSLEGELDQNALFLVIVTVNEERITANLQGPLVINKKKRLGGQFISPDDRWETRHDLMKELPSENASTC